VSWPTLSWFIAGGVSLFLAVRLAETAGSAYWGAIPTALTAAVCAAIYLKVITKAKASEASS
jgi:hypothetical protein